MTRAELIAVLKQALSDRVPRHAVTPASGGGEWLAVGRVRLHFDVLCADIADDIIQATYPEDAWVEGPRV